MRIKERGVLRIRPWHISKLRQEDERELGKKRSHECGGKDIRSQVKNLLQRWKMADVSDTIGSC